MISSDRLICCDKKNCFLCFSFCSFSHALFHRFRALADEQFSRDVTSRISTAIHSETVSLLFIFIFTSPAYLDDIEQSRHRVTIDNFHSTIFILPTCLAQNGQCYCVYCVSILIVKFSREASLPIHMCDVCSCLLKTVGKCSKQIQNDSYQLPQIVYDYLCVCGK